LTGTGQRQSLGQSSGSFSFGDNLKNAATISQRWIKQAAYAIGRLTERWEVADRVAYP
jgi:hypothetical protein